MLIQFVIIQENLEGKWPRQVRRNTTREHNSTKTKPITYLDIY